MKKFSSVSGEKVGEKPVLDNKLDEKSLFKLKVLKMVEDILTIKTHGPIDRYYRAGSIEIGGKELLAEAILALMNDNSIGDKVKLLESLKADIRDWKAIDDKIDTIIESKEGKSYLFKNKVNNLLEMYKGDDDLLVGILERKFNKINTVDKMDKYLEVILENRVSSDLLNKVKNIYKLRFNEIKNREL